MQHRQADILMKEVERHYKGDFLINGELDLSRQIANKLCKKENNRFYGSNGQFSPAKMFGTDGCKKTADYIAVPEGGTVYGPYYTFPAGAYLAQFCLEKAENVTVSVSSQKIGVVAKQAVSSPQVDIIPLDFFLTEMTEQLEFKVENHASAPALFRSVEIIPQNLDETTVENVVLGASTQEENGLDDEMSNALILKRQSERQQKELVEKENCDLPEHTRLRRVKLLLRRLMRPFTVMQILFNHTVVVSLHNMQEQINLLLTALAKTNYLHQFYVTSLEKQRNEYKTLLEKLEREKVILSERIDTLDTAITQHDSDAMLVRQQNVELSERLDKLSTVIAQHDSGALLLQQQNVELSERLDKLSTVIAQHDSGALLSQQQSVVFSERLDKLSTVVAQHDSDAVLLQQQSVVLNERLDKLSTAIEQHDSDAVFVQKQNIVLNERLEAMDKSLAQLKSVAEIDSVARQDIANIWGKIKEYDANFRGVWKAEGDINANLGSVWNTYSTLRQEVFYELDVRTRSLGTAQPLHVETRIKDSAREKIESAGGQIRLNLGSGNLAVEGYLNTDARDLSNVDIVADVAVLPFETGTIDEIFSAHLIEHFTRNRMEKELLPYWYSLLKPGGIFRVIFPDLEAMIAAYNASQMSFEQMGNVIMGGQDYQLDYHYAIYSPEIVTKMLKNAGFSNIRILVQGRENGGCKESEIIAEK